MVIKAVIIDPSFVARKLLVRILEKYNDNGDTVLVTGENDTIQGAILQMEEADPDILFINTEPENVREIEGEIKEIKGMKPSLKIVFCANSNARMSIVPAWKRGADDFIMKPYKEPKVFMAIKETMLGKKEE